MAAARDDHTSLSYAGERISWTPCGVIADHDLECSTISVPMDQFNASNNHGGKSFSIPLIRMRGKNATQNLLLNPGGPGGSGVEFVYRRGVQLNTIVGEGFHLLSFDPRGINGSRPLASCYATPDDRRNPNFSPIRGKNVDWDASEAWAWSSNFVRACADSMGEHGAYLNTPQTAADMNDILDAVGQEDMYYWGFSYGTLLGQTYATLFPERSRRVIIDGVANQFDWYESPLDREEFEDSDKVLDGFLDECIKAGPDNCTLASLAETKEDLSTALTASLNDLRDNPVAVYVNNTAYGILDYWDLRDAIFSAMYRPPSWYELSANLASLLHGNATPAFLAYGFESPPSNDSTDALYVVSYNDGASGAAHWPNDITSTLASVSPILNLSLFSSSEYTFYFSKAAWSIPRTHSYIPKRGVKTAHPLLILSTTYDPICPLISARSANDAFEDSRLIEVKGYGHCSIAVPSMCITRHVRGFLYNGTLPEENVQCEADGKPYFVKPGQDGKTKMTAEFDDAEERRIHLAQVEMAAAEGLWPKPW
ncbi:Alpha/Beta hydrolase protein [Cercophora newfieldiana]|uniref:Alpha/Beta hydrolase protein n=1 Tax=Cercophora newfieldiana TaxID=92897 RepID=A0AA39YAQ1_9PEZI|nr:Alpha/Beta hydrolase protein [Cercophora newfieldiana]